jgi:glycolate oxidase iron-sulfur subunit
LENILNTSLKSFENCVKCGKCLSVCPSYNATFNEFFSPRGRIRLIASEVKDELPLRISKFEQSMSTCLLCGRCADICPNGVKTGPLVIEEKNKFNKIKNERFSLDGFALNALKTNRRLILSSGLRLSNIFKFKNLNIPKPSGRPFILHKDLRFITEKNFSDAGDMAEESSIADKNLKSVHINAEHNTNNVIKNINVGYFSGCVFNSIYPEISKSTISALNKNNISVFVPFSQSCCGLPHISSGDIASFKELALNNALSFKEKKLEYIVTSCASCSFSINKLYPLYLSAEEKNKTKENERTEVLNFSRKLVDIWEFFGILKKRGVNIKQGMLSKELDAVFHIPCHLKNSANFIPVSKNENLIGEAGSIIDNISGLNLKPLKHNYCCGNGGMFNMRHYTMSKDITKRKFEEINDASPEVILTSCSGCMLSLKDQKNIENSKNEIPVRHLIELYDKSI